MNKLYKKIARCGKSSLFAIKRHWIISCFLLIVLISAILYITGLERELNKFSDILMKLITPFTVSLGVILGYPLLKKRLMEKYISKRFDILVDANNKVRQECLRIQSKYPIKYISEQLTLEHISEILIDITKIRQTALDASSEVYKYADLVFQTIQHFYDRVSFNKQCISGYYKETLDKWMHNHILKIYDCAKYVIEIPDGEIHSKSRLKDKKLSSFVTENKISEIRGFESSISHYHTSALLVLFYGVNNRWLDEENFRLFSDSYKIAPSPSPFARLMYLNDIYAPPVLRSPDKIIFDYGYLNLVGFKRKRKTTLGSGKSKSYYILIYHNISDISFVYGTINNKSDLSRYSDSYINVHFDFDNISSFKKDGEYIILEVDVEYLNENFFNYKNKIIERFREEISQVHK